MKFTRWLSVTTVILTSLLAQGTLRAQDAAPSAPSEGQRALARQILANRDLDEVAHLGQEMFRDRLNAGSGYSEVWIRDFETFIETALEVRKPVEIRDALLVFFHFQGDDGDIVDGYAPKEKAATSYHLRSSATKTEFAAHKNTVEVDQEPSLVSAIWKYVKITGDASILQSSVNGQTVLQRLERALDYLLNNRFDAKHGLIWAATRIDWTDVQPEHPWGVEMNEASHPSLSIYDNAMFVLAIDRFLDLAGDRHPTRDKWRRVRDSISAKAIECLWDPARNKFRPHVYLAKGSPFPADFDEDRIYILGGTVKAVEAGMLTPERVRSSYRDMVNSQRFAGAATIGLINYPPYPAGFFKNASAQPHIYVNCADWTWWGGRVVQMLVTQGMPGEAYRELLPIVDRVRREQAFREWHTPENQPRGSTHFLGAAGLTTRAIRMLRQWATQD